MDLSATQVYEKEDFAFTQKISHALEEEESIQVGTLTIDSTDHQIKTGTIKIGRHNSCNIVINDTTVSKIHAEVEAGRDQGSIWISDLKSSNKTRLNNLTLRPNRLYEVKDGSVIEFGRVRAIYHTYCPANDTVIPETPAPPRQKVTSTIIPNTPDSSLNNSSSANDDGSIILGTQKDDENGIFRRPRISQQCQSSNISKKKTSINKSNDSQIAINTSDINISKNQDSIFDAETQILEEEYKKASNSIHDMETQRDLTDASEHLVEVNAKVNKQPPKLNINKIAGSSGIDIETQSYDINEMEIQRINTQNVTSKKFTTNIHTMKVQDHTENINEENIDAQKYEICKNNSREKNLARIKCNIHDLETQKFDNITEDISNLETQFELDDIARCQQSRDISNMETQLVADGMVNETSNDRANKDEDKDGIADTTKDGINHENITELSKSRSNSPASLNLSSPGVDDCSSLNQSSHLLESSALLEFFGIDKQEKIQVFNASTPKPLMEVSSERNSNIENVQNAMDNEENKDEDIFEAPTQRISYNFEALMSDDSHDSETNEENVMCEVSKKKRGELRSEEANDDSETDAEEYVAELAKKQRESSGTLNKRSNEDISNKNDPGTSVESEDIFDVLTQQLDNPKDSITNASNSSVNQPQEINEINRAIDDMESTQVINNVHQDNRTNIPNINNAATQFIVSHETSQKTVINSKDLATKNQNDVDNMATTHIANAKSIDCSTTENLDHENIDYELAPTQPIDEIEDREKNNSIHEKRPSQINLNDTLEQKLNEMFDNVNDNTNNIYELPHMSTQCLEDILESQSNEPNDKSIADNKDIDSMLQKQLKKKNLASHDQYSHNLPDTEVSTNNFDIEINVNNVNIKAKTDSQNSDVYFSTITTRRKRNILKDIQELEKNVISQNVNSSQTSKTNKNVDDDIVAKVNQKKFSKIKNKSDRTMETLNDDDRNKTISSGNNERSLRSSKLMRQKSEITSETSKQVLRDLTKLKVDDAEGNASICIPCSSANEQYVQTLNALYETDDDILTRLPAVRISGTLSNPASPSALSTSSVRSSKVKRDIESKEKECVSLREKSLRERDFENSEKSGKPSVDSRSNSVLVTSAVKISDLVDSSDDSENDTETKRFQQLADRMLSNKLSHLKRQDKGNRKNTRLSSDRSVVLGNPNQSTDVEPKSPTLTSSRITRHSSRQSYESLRDFQREACVKITTYGKKFMEPETTAIKRKTSLDMVEENMEQIISKKYKIAQVTEECSVSTRGQRSTKKIVTDRQSPNILEYFTKISSRGNSPMIENTKSSEDNKAVSKIALKEIQDTGTGRNIDSGRSNVRRIGDIMCDNQVATHISDVTASRNDKKNKLPQKKETETKANQSQEKVLRILLNPIKIPSDNESQEVERIMKCPSNAQDKNLSIRENSKAKIFQRELRSRRRKRSNSDTETDSVLTESSVSFEVGDSDNGQLDNPAPKAKRGRPFKNSASPKTQVSKKKVTFKEPCIKNSTSLSLDSSAESTIGENSQSSTGSDSSINSKVLRSKIASVKNKEKTNQNRLIDQNNSGLNASVEISPPSTPSRTRRSILSNSTSSVMKHKVLFTGIMEDYSKIVKTLGGNKVEDPTKCTVLVTDKVRRTYKFLCALAMGIPIVTIDWLRDSEAAARFLDWENYILKDPVAEAKFGFRLRKSLNKAKEKRLLYGYTVVLTPGIAPPPIEELKDMVSSCGGKTLLRPPTKWLERTVILSREEDMSNARKFRVKAPKTVTVQSTEFILTGILKQETDFDKYKLM